MTLVECFDFMGRRVELVVKYQRRDQNVRSCKRGTSAQSRIKDGGQSSILDYAVFPKLNQKA